MTDSLKQKNSSIKKTAQKIIHLLDSLKTEEEKEACLSALLTSSEMKQLAKRLKIVELLEKEVPYHRISKKLRVSSATIASVNQSFSLSARKVIVQKIGQNQAVDKLADQIWHRLPGWLKA